MNAQQFQQTRFFNPEIHISILTAIEPGAKIKTEIPAPAKIVKAKPAPQKPAPLPIAPPIPKAPPLRKVTPKVAPVVVDQAQPLTAEIIRADLATLYAEKCKLVESYHTTRSATTLVKIEAVKAQIKTLCFYRSKVDPIPTLPKIKTVTVTGYCESVYHGTDAQILVHLRNMAKSQRVASKEGLPFEGMKIAVTHN